MPAPRQMQGYYISFDDTARVDALRALNLCQRPNAVSKGCGAFKFHFLGGRLHLSGEQFLDLG